MPQDSDLIPASLLREGETLDLGNAFLGAGLPLSEIAAQFSRARNEKAHRKARKEAQEDKRLENEQTAKRQESQQSGDTALFVQVTHQIDWRIAELEESMARRYKLLERKYGENVIDGMVATFLSEEEQVGLKTDEAKNLALANKFLDQKSRIKPEYENLVDARYIRDWYEQRQLKELSTRLRNGEALDVGDKAVLKNVGFTNNQYLLLDIESSDAKDNIVDARIDQAAQKTDTSFTF